MFIIILTREQGNAVRIGTSMQITRHFRERARGQIVPPYRGGFDLNAAPRCGAPQPLGSFGAPRQAFAIGTLRQPQQPIHSPWSTT